MNYPEFEEPLDESSESQDSAEKRYVDAWLQNEESGKDYLRIEHIDSYLKEVLETLPDDGQVIDIGCGWAKAAENIKQGQRYVGVDPYVGFLEYARKKYPQSNVELQVGKLPTHIQVSNQQFDLALCSMSLHCVEDLPASIDSLFATVKEGGRLVITTFAESAKQALIDSATQIVELDDAHLKGLVKLSSGLDVETSIYFHTEAQYEQCIEKHGTWKKEYRGPIFVTYECVKNA